MNTRGLLTCMAHELHCSDGLAVVSSRAARPGQHSLQKIVRSILRDSCLFFFLYILLFDISVYLFEFGCFQSWWMYDDDDVYDTQSAG